MLGPDQLALFLAAAFVLAVMPGPGIFYVATRALAGGRAEGVASSLGTGLGGMVHVTAGAVGVSAVMLASAELFALLKLLGALYLAWLGLRTILAARRDAAAAAAGLHNTTPAGTRRAFREGVLVEALNPKTAAFFLALLPQFVDADRGHVAVQFVALGLISVVLNTAADLVVVHAAGAVRSGLAAHPRLVQHLREASGAVLIALGAGLLLTRRPLPS
jgi:threonine/homoserine/homoserine lactone efflux protein